MSIGAKWHNLALLYSISCEEVRYVVCIDTIS